VAPDLLVYPVLNEREALAGVSDRKVINPAAQYRVDQLDDPVYWLRLVASEYCFELPQQRRSFLELRRVVGAPYAPTTANAAEVESQKAEALAAGEIYDSTLLVIDFDL
jgi:hypothetical protein